jgi:MFS family permease
MNKPPLKTMLLGHPIIGLPIYAVSAFVLYCCSQDSGLWLFGVGALVAIITTQAAGEQADAYRNWKRAWDAMSDDPPRPARWPAMVGKVLVAALALFIAGHDDRLTSSLVLGWLPLVGGGLLALLAMLLMMRWLRRRSHMVKNRAVTVAITRPIFAVPDMLQCYRSLPEHCQSLLRQQR